MQKEFLLASKNRSVLQEQLYQRTAQAAELRGHVRAYEIHRLTGREEYSEMALKVADLTSQLLRQEDETRALEDQLSRKAHLDFDMRRTMRAALVERHKCIALIYEFGVQRNVHRWEVIAAVDPHYVTSLKFKGVLSRKVDARHQELMTLLDEKENLERQLEAAKIPPERTARVMLAHMRIYKDSLKQMEEQLITMEEEIRQNRELLAAKNTAVTTSRDLLGERKVQTIQLKDCISVARNQASSPVYYMTEPVVPRPLVPMPNSNRRVNQVAASAPMSLGGVALLGRPGNRRTSSMLAQSTPFYGKATFLPPMHELAQLQTVNSVS
jgi:hypothetical protein